MQKQKLDLYYFDSCPFCTRVLKTIKKLSLEIGMCNTLEGDYRKDLKQYGGSTQVPCLKIEKKGKIRWLYESADIIDYLEEFIE